MASDVISVGRRRGQGRAGTNDGSHVAGDVASRPRFSRNFFGGKEAGVLPPARVASFGPRAGFCSAVTFLPFNHSLTRLASRFSCSRSSSPLSIHKWCLLSGKPAPRTILRRSTNSWPDLPLWILRLKVRPRVHVIFLTPPRQIDEHRHADHTGATPLIVAVKNGHVEIIKALLDRGTPHRRISRFPATPISPTAFSPPYQVPTLITLQARGARTISPLTRPFSTS